MKTSEPCQQTLFDETELPSMQSAAASPAKTLAMLESALALKVKGLVCGESTGDLLANYDPASSSWRTSQACLVSGWEPFSETWPRSGMMLSGTVYLRQPLAHHTSETGSGLWPTPSAQWLNEPTLEHTAKRFVQRRGDLPLSQMVRMFPTPSASDNRDRGNLSTPSIRRRVEKGKQLMLSMVVSEVSGRLNPTWVEWLMGFPTGHTDLKPSEMPSSPKSLRQSGGPSWKD